MSGREPTKMKKSRDPQQEEDVGEASSPQRNYRGMFISLLVIVVVCSLITTSVLLLTPSQLPASSRSRLTVADLYHPEFKGHDPEVTWISDSCVVFRDRDGHVIRFDTVLNESDILLTNRTFESFKAESFSFSPDLQFALFSYDVEPVCRDSHTASYLIYSLHTREVWELDPPEVHHSVLQFASWGKRGNQLIFIFENNIFYRAEVKSDSLRITSSGVGGVIFNGLSDWLYQEEVLGSPLALWWAPDGERLAFLTINNTLVPNMVLPQFTGSVYPQSLQYPYPAAGQRNPVVCLWVVRLSGLSLSLELQPPQPLISRDFYISMVTWVGSSHLCVRWLNRHQNVSIATLCDAHTGSCQQRHEESSDTWISRQTQVLIFSRDLSSFFITTPTRQGGQGDFHHVTMVTRKSDQNVVLHLTSGGWEVTRLLAYDEDNHILYFLSTEEGAEQRHLYSVRTRGSFPRKCLTCSLKEECSFYDANVSPDVRYAVLHCRGPGVPAVLVLRLDHHPSYFLLEDNIPLRNSLDSRRKIQTHTRTITNEDFDLPLKLSYPTDFSDSALYGLLLIVGSSPGLQGVSDLFQLHWDQVLVGSDQVIIARLDGRGSGFRGQRVLHQLYGSLGSVDVDDQISALEYLVKLPFIDRTRVGVYGEAYGGFVSLMMMKSSRLIRCVAAVSPVTDWSMYASAFSERYLGVPSSQESAYQSSRLLPDLQGFEGGTLFLSHGTSDAKVPFHHSAALIKHLIKIGGNYSLQIFPDEGHYLCGQSQVQLTHSLIGYFKGCLLDSASLLDQQRDED